MALFALPAFAQGNTQGNNANPNGGSPSHSAGMQPSQMQSTQGAGGSEQQRLVQDLEKAGFTHVRVDPQVYIVHARNSQGEPVVMRIGPDSVEAVTAMTNTNGNGSSSGMNGSGNGGSTKDGSGNVRQQ
jgi:hypothetical protein